MKKGDRVRMGEGLKAQLRLTSRAHLREFGDCVGIVQGPTDYNNCEPDDPAYDPEKIGPGVDVRWQPSNLRYGYDPGDLVLVDADP